MTSLDGVHQQLLNDWRKESMRNLSELDTILKSVQMEMEWKKLMADWKKENKNLESIGLKLKQLKELMNNADALRGLSHETIILIHRDVFEIEVLYAILRSDLDSFQQAINVVLSFYKSYSSSEKWPNKWLMIGLNLMYLLATNQHPEFHMLLEQIDEEIQQNNPYIHIPLTLEQSVMEGAYHKILLTKKNIPSPYYTLFMHMSMNTIREEIAACVESAFIQITQRDAAKLLLFNDVHELMPFAEKRGWKSTVLDGQNAAFVFHHPNQTHVLPPAFLDTKSIVKQAIFYAKQLETIV